MRAYYVLNERAYRLPNARLHQMKHPALDGAQRLEEHMKRLRAAELLPQLVNKQREGMCNERGGLRPWTRRKDGKTKVISGCKFCWVE